MASHRDYAHGGSNAGLSSSSSPAGNAQKSNLECEGCFEERPLIRLPCSHSYCKGCIIRLFQHAVNINHFPAACCVPMSIDTWDKFLPEQLVLMYRQKEAESIARNPLHCHRSDCSFLIPKIQISLGIGKCDKCGMSTCAACKQAAHDGDCPDDEVTRRHLEYIKARGWKKCPLCGNAVELFAGCAHIKCRCGCEFCYKCGNEWEACECEDDVIDWEEDLEVDWEDYRQLLERLDDDFIRIAGEERPREEIRWITGDANITAEEQERYMLASHRLMRASQMLEAGMRDIDIPDQTILNGINNRELQLELQRRLTEWNVNYARINRIRTARSCDHPEWQDVYGPTVCHGCLGAPQNATYQCLSCEFTACTRCRTQPV